MLRTKYINYNTLYIFIYLKENNSLIYLFNNGLFNILKIYGIIDK
jgi:hypothetical protein